MSAMRAQQNLASAQQPPADLGTFYAMWMEQLKVWAQAGTYDANTLCNVGGTIQNAPPLDVATLAIVVAATTDVGVPSKVNHYRTEVNTFLAQRPASPIDSNWHAKDSFQLWCEILLFTDLGPLQSELTGLAMQGIITFGRDAAAVFGILLQGRARYGWGRAAEAAETQWLLPAALKAMAQAEAYLHSEHSGDLNLTQLVQTLPQ